jgi:hypothetical protein
LLVCDTIGLGQRLKQVMWDSCAELAAPMGLPKEA